MSNDPKRAAVLGAIRSGLGRGERSADARAELAQRLAKPTANLLPAAVAKLKRDETVELFVEKAEQVNCTVRRVASADEVPAAVSDYLREHNLPPDVILAPSPSLRTMPWDKEKMLQRREGVPGNDDLVSVTPAFAGVAETGTLVMASGPEHPATLNFLPDHHIVALTASQVHRVYEEAFAAWRKANKKRGRKFEMPRNLNLITGPSRTGDIALKIELGAHGPRSLHILLIEDEQPKK
ncbi:MAG: LUD domain-containing protein [Alphaproteobacteria bacterium]